MRRLLTLAVAVFATLSCAKAYADPITYNVDFTASGTAVASASYTVTFDPTLFYTDATAGLVVNSFSGFTAPAATGFNYDPVHGLLSFGGLLNGVGQVYGGTNDYTFFLLNFNTSPIFGMFSKASPSAGSITGTVKVTQVAATPEPSGFVLLGTGALGVIGATRRRWA